MEIMREPDESFSDAWGIPSPAVAHCDARIEGGTRTGCVAGGGWAFEHLDEPLPVFFLWVKVKIWIWAQFLSDSLFPKFWKGLSDPKFQAKQSWIMVFFIWKDVRFDIDPRTARRWARSGRPRSLDLRPSWPLDRWISHRVVWNDA